MTFETYFYSNANMIEVLEQLNAGTFGVEKALAEYVKAVIYNLEVSEPEQAFNEDFEPLLKEVKSIAQDIADGDEPERYPSWLVELAD